MWNRTDCLCCMAFPIARIDVTSAIGARALTKADHRRRTHWLQEADRLNFEGQVRPAAINGMVPTTLARAVHVVFGPTNTYIFGPGHTSFWADWYIHPCRGIVRTSNQSLRGGQEKRGPHPKEECGSSISVSRGSELRAQHYRR